ncbi:NlpC/P60 family protein [[Clostridium] symbiosum]|uniref:C40 family peptidase n=1 Tax=Clostridium symbiosum TaxID=1512 RepID=UPI0018A01274|nr:NlpC/P60 family protein [[Clostridium] symbiosum]MDB2035838.1 NlpC/P60 family protein [[Clostridium] symbiosum]
MRKFHPLITRILVMTASGFLLISIAGSYTPAVSPAPEQAIRISHDNAADISQSGSLPVRIMNLLNQFAGNSASYLSGLDSKTEETYSPSVFKYNLMALYPDEQEISPEDETATQQERVMRLLKYNLKPFYDFFKLSFHTRASDSYGGQMYEYLNRKDAEWTSELYRWLQASPEQAAKMLRHPASSVTGKYDPTNKAHDPANPATWLIPSWKNVSFQFYDGDGKSISLYSNAQEIASMASVYTWFTGWTDVDNFKSYIDELWQLSHGYSVTVGAVYYCDGCVDPNDAESDDDAETEPALSASSETSGESQAEIPSDVLPEGQNGASETSQEAAAAQASPSELSGPSEDTAAAAGEHAVGGQDGESNAVPAAEETQIQLNEEGKFCPGHVDLTITARITGLSEQKNLFTLDKRGHMKTEAWNGWSDYGKAYVNRLNSQDWALLYNLSPIELALGKPLTFTEISEYLKLLPDDISRERKAVITYALQSVGKIPYYYGGKAKVPGYEGNNFAVITPPDRKGRIISGLDCSGWVNWVYWSSLGKIPTNLGTSGLIYAGRAVSRSDLKPGDIIIRLGVNSHVVMFLAWAPNGQMICIHETGGSVSNVTVSVMDANWPYYRSLLD